MRRAIATSAFALALVACSGDPRTPVADPSNPSAPSSSSAPSTSLSNSPSATAPPYLRKFTQDERAAYLAAVDDIGRFAGRNAAFYRVGVATVAARNYYMRATSAWQSYWAELRQFDSRGIRVVGEARTIRTRPISIRLLENGGRKSRPANLRQLQGSARDPAGRGSPTTPSQAGDHLGADGVATRRVALANPL